MIPYSFKCTSEQVLQLMAPSAAFPAHHFRFLDFIREFPDKILCFLESTKNPVRTCRLQFDAVGEKRTGDCFRAGRNTTAQTPTCATRRVPLTARFWGGLNAVDDTG